jgi:PqqD family protein of HPr-rel-A system
MLGGMFVSCPIDDILWVSLDDNFVVYHRPSGKTHFLNQSSKVLITEILADAKDLSSVLAAFAHIDTDAHSEDLARQVTGMLDRLEDVGLIQRV